MSAPAGHREVRKRQTINVGKLHTGNIHEKNKMKAKEEKIEGAWGAMFKK